MNTCGLIFSDIFRLHVWELVMLGCNFLHGSDLNENGNLKDRKIVMNVYKILHRGNLHENVFFQKRKLFMFSFGIEG